MRDQVLTGRAAVWANGAPVPNISLTS